MCVGGGGAVPMQTGMLHSSYKILYNPPLSGRTCLVSLMKCKICVNLYAILFVNYFFL